MLHAQALSVRIETERLALVPLGPEHASQLFEPMQDPSIFEWISATPPASVEALEASWTRLAQRLLTDQVTTWLAWAVRRKADGAWIGKLDANVESATGVASNVGYLFFPCFWGQGYATEAVAALCATLSAMGVREQFATVTRGNGVSERVLQRAGFHQTRTIAGNDTIRGVAVDDVEYRRVERHKDEQRIDSS